MHWSLHYCRDIPLHIPELQKGPSTALGAMLTQEEDDPYKIPPNFDKARNHGVNLPSSYAGLTYNAFNRWELVSIVITLNLINMG